MKPAIGIDVLATDIESNIQNLVSEINTLNEDI